MRRTPPVASLYTCHLSLFSLLFCTNVGVTTATGGHMTVLFMTYSRIRTWAIQLIVQLETSTDRYRTIRFEQTTRPAAVLLTKSPPRCNSLLLYWRIKCETQPVTIIIRSTNMLRLLQVNSQLQIKANNLLSLLGLVSSHAGHPPPPTFNPQLFHYTRFQAF